MTYGLVRPTTFTWTCCAVIARSLTPTLMSDTLKRESLELILAGKLASAVAYFLEQSQRPCLRERLQNNLDPGGVAGVSATLMWGLPGLTRPPFTPGRGGGDPTSFLAESRVACSHQTAASSRVSTLSSSVLAAPLQSSARAALLYPEQDNDEEYSD